MKHMEIEAIIEKGSLKKEKIKRILENLGNSLVIGEMGDYYKIHIHTYSEKKVMQEIEKLGKIINLRKTHLP